MVFCSVEHGMIFYEEEGSWTDASKQEIFGGKSVKAASQRPFCDWGIYANTKWSIVLFGTCVRYNKKKAAGSGRRDKKLSWLYGWLLPPDSVEEGLGERTPSQVVFVGFLFEGQKGFFGLDGREICGY